MTTTEKVDRHHWHGGKSYNDDDCAICDEVMRRDNDAMLLRTVTTEKVKHTGGPWTAHLNANAELSVFSGDEIIAVTWEPESFGDEGRTQEITQANARLIAASPELLEALEIVTRHLNINNLPVDDMRKVEAAIRRAKGE